MIAFFVTTLLASFAGSLHCAGMCGPLLVLVQGGRASPGLQAGYHVGRLVIYLLLGVTAAAVGHSVETAAAARGLEQASLLLGGLALLLALVAPLLRAEHIGRGASLWAMRAALRNATPLTRAALFGAATGLMPCGWLYAWLAVAATTGSSVAGGAVMLGFGLGSLPAMTVGSVLFTRATATARLRSRRLVPLLLVVSALAVVARGTVVARLHRALANSWSTNQALVCHGDVWSQP